MTNEADVIVLGLGTAGEDLSLQLLDAGLSVIGVESALLGGECPYWACIPSKMIVRAGNLLQSARRVEGMAGQATVLPDWGQVARRITEEATGGWDDSFAAKRFTGLGGTLVRGRGRLASPRSVDVDGQTYTASRGVVLCVGAHPTVPPIPGLDEIDAWGTHEMLQAETLPDALLIIGGGAVACELGQSLARFGTRVTIVEGGQRVLHAEEPETSALVTEAMGSEGVAVRTGVRVERVARAGGEVRAWLSDGSQLTAARILLATGRHVDLRDLGLESVGLDASASAVPVDGRCRAGAGLWAIGDVTGIAGFTHIGLYQGRIVRDDILGRHPTPADYSAIPRITFTDPEVGSVGMTEEQARGAGMDVTVVLKNLPSTFRGWLEGPGNIGLVKLIVDRGSGLLVGGTAVGPCGGDVLGLLSLAVHAKVPAEQLKTMIYAFPSFHGVVGEALGASGAGVVKQVLDPGYVSPL